VAILHTGADKGVRCKSAAGFLTDRTARTWRESNSAHKSLFPGSKSVAAALRFHTIGPIGPILLSVRAMCESAMVLHGADADRFGGHSNSPHLACCTTSHAQQSKHVSQQAVRTLQHVALSQFTAVHTQCCACDKLLCTTFIIMPNTI
jgi:hypothetical protein